MSGIQEILVIVAIILIIFFLPGIMRQGENNAVKPFKKISGKMRAAIAVSFFYIAIAAFFFKPWHGKPLLFLYAGLAPVATGWTIRWVSKGFNEKDKK